MSVDFSVRISMEEGKEKEQERGGEKEEGESGTGGTDVWGIAGLIRGASPGKTFWLHLF